MSNRRLRRGHKKRGQSENNNKEARRITDEKKRPTTKRKSNQEAKTPNKSIKAPISQRDIQARNKRQSRQARETLKNIQSMESKREIIDRNMDDFLLFLFRNFNNYFRLFDGLKK